MRFAAAVLSLVVLIAPAAAGAEECNDRLPALHIAGGGAYSVDATMAPRLIAIGPESGGAETAAAFNLGVRLGAFRLGAETAIARGSLGREDVDAMMSVLTELKLTSAFRLEGELRARTELQDVVKTDDDFGRALELRGLAGGAFTTGRVEVAALAGYESPRGLLAPGPLALVTVTGRF
jgi:hypothetical protein